MKLAFIPLGNLTVSKANMRYARKVPDVSDILPTVRSRGVIQPILVRPCAAAPDSEASYEIVAGARRFHAATLVAAERAAEPARAGCGDPGNPAGTGTTPQGADGLAQCASDDLGPDNGDPGVLAPDASGTARLAADTALMPCAILDDDDDASAVEASLIENIARLDPDEVARWECFTRLIREGRTPQHIALTFGLPDLAVRRILALGNLLPRIRDLYRREEIDAATVRHLTLASRSQQKAWLALMDDENAYAPRGYQLKSWLLGGASISTCHALFDVGASKLAVIADLFGDDSFFADCAAFWTLQNAAVEERRAAFLAAGWADVLVMPPDTHFHAWEHEKVAKRKGGHVYLDVRGNGEVVIHEGYLSRKDAARIARAELAASGGDDGMTAKPARAELTSLTQTYVDLHRHAALRAELQGSPGIALRLMVAHAIAGSTLWRVTAEPQAVKSDAIRLSLEVSRAEAVFDERRRGVLAALGLPEDEPSLTGSTGYAMAGARRNLCALLARLVALPDTEVLEVLALVMGETLAAGSAEVEALGTLVGLGMADWWQADEAFLDTLRDREVLLAMVAEVAGPQIAAANAREKGKALKAIIRAHLAGEGGREKKEGWVPRWMAFPPSTYTARGGVGTVLAHDRALAALEPDPDGGVDADADNGGGADPDGIAGGGQAEGEACGDRKAA
ncbi:ParB family chromosome partitioning protein [Novosphingobium sp. PhB55]|uniref:ParB N-terminal domain-containing protein n=1 Tax=Novosphingobium sp. PhB55 TaxID=2485106 RepID=UPI0010F37BCC|nr:ParB N-terminal domain-containing protein [Novosphingobium sp. PhB55]TDW61576.1 ParB family chromosome partitioning protein [Novosphingobium sp. PhB55]